MTGRTATPLEPLIDAAESATVLDAPGKAIGKQVRSLIKQPLKDALSGTWLGHALHPLMTDVVVGTFLSTTLLDLAGGDKDGRAGARLIGIGMAAYAPTALTGVNDWADTEPVSDGVGRHPPPPAARPARGSCTRRPTRPRSCSTPARSPRGAGGAVARRVRSAWPGAAR